MDSDLIAHGILFSACLYSGLFLAGIIKLPEKQQQRIDRQPKKTKITWLILDAFLLAGFAYFIYKDLIAK
jgi:hypothetical protein